MSWCSRFITYEAHLLLSGPWGEWSGILALAEVSVQFYPPIHCISPPTTNTTTTDKSPQLMDFVSQIKASTDTAQLFESIQADATITISTLHSVEIMDLS